MKIQSSKLIQRTAATLAALVFALVSGVCALSDSKKVKAAELPAGLYVADTYIGTFNGYQTDYNVYFGFDSDNFNIAVTIFSFSSVDGITVDSGDTSISNIYDNGDYWGGVSDYYWFLYFSSSDVFDFSLTSSVSKSYFYNVPLSESAFDYFEDPSFNDITYTLILYTFSDGVNSHDIEVYIPYSDLTRKTIEAQQSAENAIQENQNLKRQGAIMIVVIISMIIGFCVLLFTRGR